MNIPLLGNIDTKTGLIILAVGVGAFLVSKNMHKEPLPPGGIDSRGQPTTTAIVSDDDSILTRSGWRIPFHGDANMHYQGSLGGSYDEPGSISAYSARAYDATTTTTTTDPAVLDIENQILSQITHGATNISSVIPNIDTIKAEIKTHEGQIAIAVQNRKSGYISSAQMQQFIAGIVTDVTTKLQIQMNDTSGGGGTGGGVPDYYQQYYKQYQDYLNQLNNNYYNYYQPAYQYYPGTTYDYYQPYQYQYPNPYQSPGQYGGYSYPYYGSNQYYNQYPSYMYQNYYYPQQQQGGGGLINIGSGSGGGLINIGTGGGNSGGLGGLFGGLF